MKSSNSNSLHKFVTFLLIAVLLVFVVGFAANGWQEDFGKPDNGEGGDKTDNTDENTDGTNSENNGNNDNSNMNNDNTNDNNSDNNNNDNQTPPVNDTPNDENENIIPPAPEEPEIPTYINTMTGLEVSQTQSTTVPMGFVIDPSAPLYGISNSDLAIEFPIEDGTTRMLSYTTDNSLLWKIGSLVETRAFISGMSNFFGGIVISYGNDDMIKYSAWDVSKIELDLSRYSNSYYLENTLYVYTSKEKVDIAKGQAASLQGQVYKATPFDFSDEELIFGATEANSVIIPFSENSETELYYSEKTDRYLYYKSGNRKMDMLSGKNVTFENVFILFANATTYEKANGTELVIDIMSGGKGYYITKGTLMEITWALNENGELNFYALNGQKLVANTGNSYIAYYKASCSSSVKIN